MSRRSVGVLFPVVAFGLLGGSPSEPPSAVSEMLIKGTYAYEGGRWKEAIEHYTAASQLSVPHSYGDIGVWDMLSRAYFHAGETTKALETLDTLRQRYLNCEVLDSASSCSLRDHALLRVASNRAWILRSTGRYAEAIREHMTEKKQILALDDQNRTLTDFARAYHKLGDQNGCDMKMAECFMEGGNTTAAVAIWRKLMECYQREGTLGLAGLPSQRERGELLDRYYVNVYINKRLGDCLGDASYYQRALAASRGFSERETEEMQKTIGPKQWIERDALERLCAQRLSDQGESDATHRVPSNPVDPPASAGCGCGCGSTTATAAGASPVTAASPAGSTDAAGRAAGQTTCGGCCDAPTTGPGSVEAKK